VHHVGSVPIGSPQSDKRGPIYVQFENIHNQATV